jgi:hypothetical protein
LVPCVVHRPVVDSSNTPQGLTHCAIAALPTMEAHCWQRTKGGASVLGVPLELGGAELDMDLSCSLTVVLQPMAGTCMRMVDSCSVRLSSEHGVCYCYVSEVRRRGLSVQVRCGVCARVHTFACAVARPPVAGVAMLAS